MLELPPETSKNEQKGQRSRRMPTYTRQAIEDAMDAYDEYKESGKHSDIFGSDRFKDPRVYWVRSAQQIKPCVPIQLHCCLCA